MDSESDLVKWEQVYGMEGLGFRWSLSHDDSTVFASGTLSPVSSSWGIYTATLAYDNLGVSRLLTARSRDGVWIEARAVILKWGTQALREREREAIADAKEQAIRNTEEAQQVIQEYKTMLSAALALDHRLEWSSLYRKEPFKPFEFENAPTYEQIAERLNVPKKPYFPELDLLDFLFYFFLSPWIRKRRLEQERKAIETLSEELEEFERRKSQALAKYEQEKEDFIKTQNEYNSSMDQLRQDFKSGNKAAIEQYVKLVLERSPYPSAITKEFEVQYDERSRIVVLGYQMPNPDSLPKVIEYKFVAARSQVETKEMKRKDFEAFYESTILQICLRTIHEVLQSVYTEYVEGVVFNGWVTGVDLATGKDFTSCIISVQTPRQLFESIDLARVDPKQCVRGLKGLIAGPLAQLAPVKPILDINREDSRFIESRDILAQMNPNDNLATMDWEDFEHLVRELFGKYFSASGAEVKVTQSSRDKGVDAIAFDPDPIKGGKFVIQAKRYNNVVPVSAVRDLYGTIMNEGASRGILVTTSYYGQDSRDFAKDKPITLIDGSNLAHMFADYGYDVYIKLQE